MPLIKRTKKIILSGSEGNPIRLFCDIVRKALFYITLPGKMFLPFPSVIQNVQHEKERAD